MAHTHTSGRRGALLVVAAMAVSAVAALTLAPRALVAPARAAFMRLLEALDAPMVTGDAEIVLNTLMFVPVGAAVALLLPRRAWLLAILVGAGLSAGVEFLQASIPGRVPDADDVLWNSAGTVIGALLVTVVRVGAALVRGAQRGRATRT